MSLNKRMGDTHEKALSDLLGGAVTRGSGNQWKAQMDGRHNRMKRRFAFAWDGKSTLREGLSVTLKMWHKAREQSGGERPMLALRFYSTEKLDVVEDLVVLSLDDFTELLEAAEHAKKETTRLIVFEGEQRLPGSPVLNLRFVLIKDGVVSFPRNVHFHWPMDELMYGQRLHWSPDGGPIAIEPSRPTPEINIDGVPLKGFVEVYRYQTKILDEEI